jgi:septal ring factor EnvC (AmiA/AmiB activator)
MTTAHAGNMFGGSDTAGVINRLKEAVAERDNEVRELKKRIADLEKQIDETKTAHCASRYGTLRLLSELEFLTKQIIEKIDKQDFSILERELDK